MPAFDTLQRAAFANFEFPVSEIEVIGGLREHVHEYPHSPGGSPEKLGRKLYEIRMVAPFHNTFKAWPKLWPETLTGLRNIYELGETHDLVIPTIGTIKAYCFAWPEKATAKARSGVEATFSFREDQSSEALVDTLIAAKSADISAVAAQAVALAEDQELPMDAFDGIQEFANDIAAIKDQADLQFDKLDAKLTALEHSVRLVQTTVKDLDKPKHHKVLAKLHDIAVACIDLDEDVMKKAVPIVIYVTKTLMSVVDVSIAMYGRSDRGVEVLRLNALENPFEIPRGTALRVYAL